MVTEELRNLKHEELEEYLAALVGGAGAFGESPEQSGFFQCMSLWSFLHPVDFFEAAMFVLGARRRTGIDADYSRTTARSLSGVDATDRDGC